MPDLFSPLTFAHGPAMANRMMLAPLTNTQSHADGTLSDEEADWLTMRATGGFGLVMTAAAFVEPAGKGFPGQLGIHDDACLPGLARVAARIKTAGSLAAVQLYHAGARTEVGISGLPPVAPSDDAETGARAMTVGEIEATIEAFVEGAARAERAGFDAIELHGAHRYLLCDFLSPDANRRTDDYGGSIDNRARPIRAIIDGIRSRCGADFGLGLRLSVERMGVRLGEIRALCGQLLEEGKLDFLDLSLWDVFKEPEEAEFKSRPLFDWFSELPRGRTRLGVAGNVRSGATAQACLEAGADFVSIGRAAIAHHDFPRRVRDKADFEMRPLPMAPDALPAEGVSPAFVTYLGSFPGFLTAPVP